MDIGMLWYDESSKTSREIIKEAANFYREKYGRKPNVCLVNPMTLTKGSKKVPGVDVRERKNIQPGHFWIGEEESDEASSATRRNGTN